MENSQEKKEIKNTIVTPESHVLLKVVSKGAISRFVSSKLFNSLSDDCVRFIALCQFFFRYKCEVYLCGGSVISALYHDYSIPPTDLDIIVVGGREDLQSAMGFFINPIRFEIENFNYSGVYFKVDPNSVLWKNRTNPRFVFEERIRLTPANPEVAPGFRQFDISFVTPEVFEKTLG